MDIPMPDYIASQIREAQRDAALKLTNAPVVVVPEAAARAGVFLTLHESRARGNICIGLTANHDGPMVELCDYSLAAPSADTPTIKVGHLVLGHVLCGLIVSAIFGDTP
jgi:DNA-binding MurR/RpiR family transcriptional regulator